jgi:hypothetical protein
MPELVLLIFFIVHGFVVNNAVLLCGFKQTKGKRYENSDSFDRTAAGIGGSVCVNRLRPVEAGGGCMSDFWKDYEPEPSMTAPVQENTMIYRTFEQWKNGNVLEHGVPRTEYYNEDQLDLVEMGWNYGYDAGRAVEQALDKKAENARELGLDYEPVQEPVAIPKYIRDAAKHLHENKFEPSFMVRAIVGWINGTPPAQPAPVQEPDHGDELTIAYMSGVHRGKELAAQRPWVGLTDEEIEQSCVPLGAAMLSFTEVARAIEAKLKEKNT